MSSLIQPIKSGAHISVAASPLPIAPVKSLSPPIDSISISKSKDISCFTWILNGLKKLGTLLFGCITFQWLFASKATKKPEVKHPDTKAGISVKKEELPLQVEKELPVPTKKEHIPSQPVKKVNTPPTLLRKYSDFALTSKKHMELFCDKAYAGWLEKPEEDPSLKKELLTLLEGTTAAKKLYKEWESLRQTKNNEIDPFDLSGFSAMVSEEEFLEKLKEDPAFIGSRIYLLKNPTSLQDWWNKNQRKHKLSLLIVEKFYKSYLKEEYTKGIVAQRDQAIKLEKILENPKCKSILFTNWRKRFPADLNNDQKLEIKLKQYILAPVVRTFIKESLSGGLPIATIQLLQGNNKVSRYIAIKDLAGDKPNIQ